MHSERPLNLFTNPFLLWSRLAWKTGEMAIASAHVIGYRANRLAPAGSIPGARERRELALMIQEKGEAALASAQAAGVRMLMLNQQFAVLAFKQMLSGSAVLMSLAASRTPAELAQRQAKLVRDAMTSSVASGSKLSGSTAKVARAALRPVHARVSGNVRRLGKRPK